MVAHSDMNFLWHNIKSDEVSIKETCYNSINIKCDIIVNKVMLTHMKQVIY